MNFHVFNLNKGYTDLDARMNKTNLLLQDDAAPVSRTEEVVLELLGVRGTVVTQIVCPPPQ